MDIKTPNGEAKVFYYTETDVEIERGNDIYLNFGFHNSIRWDEFVADSGCFFEDGSLRVKVQVQFAQSVGF